MCESRFGHKERETVLYTTTLMGKVLSQTQVGKSILKLIFPFSNTSWQVNTTTIKVVEERENWNRRKSSQAKNSAYFLLGREVVPCCWFPTHIISGKVFVAIVYLQMMPNHKLKSPRHIRLDKES